jgi:molybdate transport system regulatory protein
MVKRRVRGTGVTPGDLHSSLGWPELEGPTIALLEAIDAYHSINQAAKVVGMSYKSAWEHVETLNNLSDQALVIRMVGGPGGGGTLLTDPGRAFLGRVRLLRREFKRFMGLFAGSPEETLQIIKTLRRFEMKLSARNIWAGQVSTIQTGAVNSVVEVALKGADSIVSVITNNSVERLGLKPGSEVLAIVKASSVMIGRELQKAQLSARNIMAGTVSQIVEGAVNDEVTIQLAGGNTVTSIITRASVQRLGLIFGAQAQAVIKASSVMLAVA